MSQIDDFEKMSVTRVLLKYSVPTIISMSVQALYNIVDRIYIGKGLGTEALAGVTLTFPIFILSIAIGVLFGSGNAAVISLKLGQKKKDEAEATLGSTVFMYTFLGFVVALGGILFLDPLLYLVGATEVTMPYAREYLSVFLPFMAFDFMAMGTNGGIRSEGNPRFAMVIAILGAVINIVLDPLFLFVFHWGVAGVAWATVIARIITTGLVLWHFTKGPHRHLTLHKKNFRMNAPLVRQMAAIGLAPCLMNLATTFVAVFANRALVKFGGDMALGALGAIMSIFTIIQTPIRGVQMGAQPVIGYNYGAGLHDRVIKILGRTYVFSQIVAFAGLAVVFLWAPHLIGLFSRGDAALVEMGTTGLKIYMALIPFMAFQLITAVFFQAMGKPGRPIIMNLSQGVIFYLAALWILPGFFGLNGVWAATPVSQLLGGVLALVLVVPETVRQKQGIGHEID